MESEAREYYQRRKRMRKEIQPWQCHAQRDRRDDCQVAPCLVSVAQSLCLCVCACMQGRPWVARLPRHEYAQLCALDSWPGTGTRRTLLLWVGVSTTPLTAV